MLHALSTLISWLGQGNLVLTWVQTRCPQGVAWLIKMRLRVSLPLKGWPPAVMCSERKQVGSVKNKVFT